MPGHPSDPAPWVRDPSDDLALQHGCWFDHRAAQRPIEFLERFCRQSKGLQAGELLALQPWQRDFVSRLYGWRRPNSTRRFRSAYLEVPKKNGKSTLVSGLSLYHLLADGEIGPHVYINAYDREQASIVFDEAAEMVRRSPALAKRLDLIDSRKRIRWPKGAGRLVANSADVPSKDGAHASCVIFDELHRQRDWELWRVFRYAGLSRRQPLRLSITTAGVDRLSVCWAEHDYSVRVSEGRVPDWAHLGVIYGAGLKDDWRDPAVWRRANPSLGVTLTEEDFEADVRRVQEQPSELNEFLRLRLCVWTQTGSRFLDRAAWDACGTLPPPSWFAGRRCYAGLDLSSTTDLTALARLFVDGDRRYVLVDVWVPGSTLEKRVARDRVPYDLWVRDGWCRRTEARTIDYDAIRARILQVHKETPFELLLADPWNANSLLTQLAADQVPVKTLTQKPPFLNGPTRELERLVTEGLLGHGDNPVLTWAADNAEASRDANDLVRLSKSKSRERIDPLAAVVNAIAAQLTAPPPSVYATRGALII